MTKNEMPGIILLVTTSKDYYRGLLRGIANYYKTHELWNVHLWNPLHVTNVTELAKNWQADGIILDPTHQGDIHKLLLLNTPIVALWPMEQKHKNLLHVAPEDIPIGKIAAEYYLEKEFKSYAFCGYTDCDWSRERCMGYSQVLESKGHSVSVYEQDRSRASRQGSKELARLANWLKGLAQPLAVFACHDEQACRVIEACRMAKLEVPDKVAVLGVDNDQFTCTFFNPPLSSIALNTERAGYEVAELLQKLISGQKIDSDTVYIQPKYVTERHSTDVLHIENEDVANALNYIRQHCDQIIQVSDVLKCVSVSRRSLELKFVQTLGHSIYEEICKYHAKYIARQLIETTMSVLKIARSLGYTSEYNISRFFHKITGYTPKQYRKNFGPK